MSEAQKILSQVIEWARREEPVRALILVGSRAQNDPVDELADFDVSVFAEVHEPYLQADRWLSEIAKVWVYIPEKFFRKGELVPTRLVIFEGGVKVDFAFFGPHVLDELAESDEIDTGYKVLLDKDGKTERLPPPSFRRQKHERPTEGIFVALVNEFWFEAYHVAKYLRRDELWLVKFRDWTTKELLLRLIEWHEQSRRGWEYDVYYAGKRMKSWVDEATWDDLHRAFAHFGGEDSWDGLIATTNLFRRLATETADRLGFEYPQEVDRNITRFILRLRST